MKKDASITLVNDTITSTRITKMQQLYQGKNDIDFQNASAKCIERYYARMSPESGIKVVSNPPLAVLDYTIYSHNNVIMNGEFKRRMCNRNTYDSLMISASKIRAMQQTGIVGCIYILWLDGLHGLTVHPDEYVNFKKGGRTVQFRDKFDQNGEECAYFCTEEFKFYVPYSEVVNAIS